MIRASLHADGYTVRLDVTDAAELLLDQVARAYATDGQLVGELLRSLAVAADHHRSRTLDPTATDYGRDWSGAALDAARDRARRGMRAALLRWSYRRRRAAVVRRLRAELLDVLPAADGLLGADLSYRTAVELGEQLQQLAARTVAGRRSIELECEL
ncbi:hypothetical protein [Kitasatospora sp. NPDC088346]|uniref:hypothetical protein n=1 Tax=Kitasatospora sp. NPDC088346 TaxID=3364073 RepID=UPI0037F259A9